MVHGFDGWLRILTDKSVSIRNHPCPFDNFNDYGGTVGGPIFLPRFGEGGKVFYDGRNRSFFFFIYEGSQRKIGGSTISTLPTEAFRRGDFSSLLTTNQTGTDALGRPIFAGQIFDPATTRIVNGQAVREPFQGNIIPTTRFSNVARNVLGFIPATNRPGRFENFIFNGISPLDVYTFAVKLDDAITSKSQLYDRYSSFSPNVPNPGAGGLPVAIIFAGEGAGRSGTRTFADTYYRALGPRLGFAFSPDRREGFLGKVFGGAGKTVIRGGYGVYYQALQYADFGERMQAGFKATPGFGSVNGYDPAFQLDQGFAQNFPRPPFIDPTVSNNPGSPQVVEFISREHARPPMIQNYGLEIQRELARDLILNVGYIGLQGHRLRSNLLRYNTLRPEHLQRGNLLFADINSPEAQAAGIRPPFAGLRGNVAQAQRPFPQYGDILTDCCLENAGNSNYNAAYVKIERRFSQRLNLLASYTFSKSLTDADSALPIFATFSGGGEVQNPYDLKSEKAVSNQDVPHALVISYIYELPFGENRAFNTGNSVINKLIGGWQVGAVHRYQSGQPLSFCCSGGIPTYGRIRPGLVPGQEILSDAVRNGTFDPLSTDPARREYFNRAAFYDVNAVCTRDVAGNFVRNSPFGCRLPTEPLRFSSMPRTLSDLRSEQFFNEDINIIRSRNRIADRF